jgi:hypothetical protein
MGWGNLCVSTAEDILTRIHEKMITELAKEGVLVDAIYYCRHHPMDVELPWSVHYWSREYSPRTNTEVVQKIGQVPASNSNFRSGTITGNGKTLSKSDGAPYEWTRTLRGD